MLQIVLNAVEEYFSFQKYLKENSKMPFKVVAIEEKSGIVYTVVPHQWEKENLLYWPSNLNFKHREKLRRIAESVPEKSWDDSVCILKYGNINTFSDALEIEKKLSAASCTESEENIIGQMKRNKRVCRIRGDKVHAVDNYNNLIATSIPLSLPESRSSSPQVASHEPSVTSRHSSASIADKFVIQNMNGLIYEEVKQTDNISEDDGQEIYSQEELPCVEGVSFTDLISRINDGATEKNFEYLKSDIQSLKNDFKTDVVKLNVKMDEILRLLKMNPCDIASTAANKSSDVMIEFSFPLRSLNELEIMEKNIKSDSCYKNQLFDKIFKICGSSAEDAYKALRKVAYTIFDTGLLLNFSWTGIKKKGSTEKSAFQKFEGIIDLFLQLGKRVDCRYDALKNNTFFRDHLLKYNKRRDLRNSRFIDSGETSHCSSSKLPAKDVNQTVRKNIFDDCLNSDVSNKQNDGGIGNDCSLENLTD